MTATSAIARRLERESVAEVLEWARSTLGLTHRELGELAGATTRTAQRWANPDAGVLPRREGRTKVDQLRDLRRLLVATFPEPAQAVAWMHREVPLLEGRRPIELVRRGDLVPVVGVLAGFQSGAFA